jgi:hypothetical protein
MHKRVTLVLGDDRDGLYLDGWRFVQGHSITERDWISLIPYLVGSTDITSEIICADTEWLDDLGEYPKELAHVVRTGKV